MTRGVWLASLGAALLGAACSLDRSAPTDTAGGPPSHDAPRSDAPPAPLVVAHAPATLSTLKLDDAHAVAWLQTTCGACHGPKANGARDMTWPMPPVLTREWLEATESTTVAYELLRRKLREPSRAGFPSPMPPGDLDATNAAELEHVVEWFERRLPFTVADADVAYHRKVNALPRPKVAFACEATATLRDFTNRLTLAALDRAPTAAELGAFSATALDAGVTAPQRAEFVSRLSSAWRAEFVAAGLKKLATTLALAGTVTSSATAPLGGPPDEVFPGVNDELYELLKANIDSWPYPQYFTEDVVMANPATAPIYGCSVGAGWAACPLLPPRRGYFTTLGYLSNLPQSFLRVDGGTRRYVGIYRTLIGEAHARSGVIGPASMPLPDCIDATDTRYEIGPTQRSPDGVAATLESGQVCQSCHLRGMAAAEILFRPFATSGRLYDAAHLGAPGTPDVADFQDAVTAKWGYGPTAAGPMAPVDGAFLRSLLAASGKACATTDDPAHPLQRLADVGALTRFMMANRDALARGFARQAHRTFSKTETVTLEVQARMLAQFDADHTRILDLVGAYFSSDSFACAEER